MQAPPPAGEPQRLELLRECAVLDTPREDEFDEIAELAGRICEAPMALITFVDERRQWCKAQVGLAMSEIPRELAFCAHAIVRPQELLVVPDATKDVRFADNPYVTAEDGVRFYAGAPLVAEGGHALGALCVLDRVPRQLRPEQRRALEILGRQVMTQLRLRRNLAEQARLQAVLRESEQEQQRRNALLRMVGRVAQIGGWRIEMPDRIVSWSDEMFEVLEVPAGTPPGMEQTLEFFPPEGRAEVVAAIEACVKEGKPFGLEAEIQTAKGRRIWVRVSGEAERRPDGTVSRVQGTLQNITDRKQAESEAGEMARQLTATLESLTDGFFTLDRAWRFVYVNAAAERMLHRPRRELLGRNLLDMFPEVRGTVSEREYGRALLDGNATQFETFYPPLGAWFEARAFPTAQGLAVYFRDITTVKLAADALRASEERFREMAENIGDVFYNFDPVNDRVLYANEAFAKLWGRPMAALLADPRLYFEGIHPEDRPVSLEAYATQRQGRETEVEYRVLRPDGSIRWVREHAAPMLDRTGRVERIVGTMRDVTERRQDVERIRMSEERFQLVAKATRDAIWDWDLVSNAIWWSEGFEIMFGYRRDEIEPTIVSWTTRVHADDRDAVVSGIHHAIDHGAERWTAEYRFRRQDGSYARVLDRGYIIRDAEGRALRMIGGMADITERHEAAERLRASEEQYRLLFAGNPHPMWVFDMETLRFLAVNDAAVRHYGYSAEEFLGMTLLDLRTEDDTRSREEVIARMPRAGRATGHRRHRKKDGTVIDVEASSDNVTINGRPARLVLAQDITERMRAERKLREQAALLDKAQDAILVRDLEHRILYCNKSAERLYGWRAEEVLNRSVRDLLYFDPAVFDEAMTRLLSAGEWVGELTQKRSDGGKLLIEGRWTLVRNEAGEATAVLAINTDITERKKLELQFLRAQRMESIGTLAGGIAHDLNNLLAPIMMGVGLLRNFEATDKAQRVIDNIERSAQRGSELVKQVLSFARGVEGARVVVHLRHVVAEIESIVGTTFPKNIEIVTELPPDLWLVLGDPTQLNQVLLNLCVNARDAMAEGGRLAITLSNVMLDEQYAAMNRGVAAGRYVCLEVADSGCGMPPEVQNRIFDPFFTTKETGKGTGLGLSTALGIVRSHGGFMSVYSEPGKGSTFKVCLPAQEITAAEAEAAPAVVAMPRGRGETILVVDDEPAILSVTRQTLETFGYRTLGAEDGAQAIGLYALHRADIAVVLTDIMMPVMDGPALIAAIRRINPAVRIIAASGLNANGNVARAAVAGVRHFLAKPYTADALLGLLRQAIEETEAEKT